MASEDILRLQVKALTSVLKGFDKIYGLDDEHVDLIKYCSDCESFDLVRAKVGILFCSSEDSDSLSVKSDILKKAFPRMEISNVRFSSLSGKLMTVRFNVSSGMPLIILATYIENGLLGLSKLLDVEDISLGKIECLK